MSRQHHSSWSGSLSSIEFAANCREKVVASFCKPRLRLGRHPPSRLSHSQLGRRTRALPVISGMLVDKYNIVKLGNALSHMPDNTLLLLDDVQRVYEFPEFWKTLKSCHQVPSSLLQLSTQLTPPPRTVPRASIAN